MSRVVDFYFCANSFAAANDIGKFIRASLISVIDTEQHISRIIKAAKENDQILHSIEFPAILKKYIAQNPTSADLIDEKLTSLDLYVQGVSKS